MKKILYALGLSATIGLLPLMSLGQVPATGDRTIEVVAGLSPKAPASGENRLELTFTEAGKPVAGLKLTTSVGMTNMDMGTAHPAVKEISPGHYVIRPMLLMDGPWRVTVIGKDPKFTLNFDMTAGSKQPWQPAKQTIKLPGASNESPPTKQTEPPTQEPVKQEPTKTEQPAKQGNGYGHDMAGMGHVAASLPQLKEKSSYSVKGDEDWDTRTGFGKQEGMVRMMILMMVAGSGMEGMKMPPMEMVFNDATFSEEDGATPQGNMPAMNGKLKVDVALKHRAAVGDNEMTVTILSSDDKPVAGAKVVTAVAMTSMDMGTTHPAVKDLGKGKYSLKAKFSMQGPWRLTLTVTPKGQEASTYTFDFEVK